MSNKLESKKFGQWLLLIQPVEGYMVEFLENDGAISKLAWLTPEQIEKMELFAK